MVHLDDLVAVDPADPSRVRVLVRRGSLLSSLGATRGHIDGVDLSPDGTTVAFTFNVHVEDRPVSGRYEVPVDGSGEAVPIGGVRRRVRLRPRVLARRQPPRSDAVVRLPASGAAVPVICTIGDHADLGMVATVRP